MSAEPSARATLFARLLCDVMIPAEFSAAIRAQGYDVAEARTLPVAIQQDDEAILQNAAQQQRVVITRNYSAQLQRPSEQLLSPTRSMVRPRQATRGDHSYSSVSDQQSFGEMGGARSSPQLFASTYRR
jgi:hypothetical protein